MQLFFDLDGTLIDVQEKHYRAYCAVIDRKPLPKSLFWSKKRNHEPISPYMHIIEEKEYLALDRLFPFTLSVLTELAKKHTLHLVSSRRNRKNAEEQISRLGLTQFFETISFGPEAKQTIQAQPPFMLIGDTEEEILAAQKFGGISVAVLSGLRNRKLLSPYHPDKIVNDIRGV